MQSLGDIRELLAAHGLRPKHRLGQNFLHDHNHLARIIDAASLKPGDHVLEVGPGTGALTVGLLEHPANVRVTSVEIDADLQPILQQVTSPWRDRFDLIIGDALAGKHELSPQVASAIEGSSFKLIANLPYNAASPVIVNLCIDHPEMTRAVVMVQREVADRLVAGPGGATFGPMGVIVQAVMDVTIASKLSAGCFWPQPKVSSSVVVLTRRAEPLCEDIKAFARFIHKIFTSRRKQLGSILGRDHDWPAGITPTMRPQALSVEQLVALAGSCGGDH